jgi:hypothetical protein
MTKLAPLAFALLLLSCETPLRSASAQATGTGETGWEADCRRGYDAVRVCPPDGCPRDNPGIPAAG